jgi:hypothetical protein
VAKIETALLCDYVRVDENLAHVTAGNINQLFAPQVPTAHNVGLLLVTAFEADEAGPYLLDITIRGPGGQELGSAQTKIGRGIDPNDPDVNRRAAVGLNIGMVFPEYGTYRFEVAGEGEVYTSFDLRVLPPREP